MKKEYFLRFGMPGTAYDTWGTSEAFAEEQIDREIQITRNVGADYVLLHMVKGDLVRVKVVINA